MAKWEYIRGSWWIFVIPHIVFLTVGIVLLITYSNGLRTPESSWFPMDEILFLGIVFIVFPPIATLFLIFRINKHNRKQDLIIKDGIQLQGKILSLCETGNLILETLAVGNLSLAYKYLPGRHNDAVEMTRRHVELANRTGSKLLEL